MSTSTLSRCPRCGGTRSLAIYGMEAGALECTACGYQEFLDAQGVFDEVLESARRRQESTPRPWWQFWKR